VTFEQEWARCRPWIEAANAYGLGTHAIDDVRDAILAGEAHFWPGENCAVVTEFDCFPRLKSLHFWLCGGDLTELVEILRPRIEDWAKAEGCTRFTTCGRAGWQRVMARHGYSPTWHVCSKDAD
jgi:hypothetical protein